MRDRRLRFRMMTTMLAHFNRLASQTLMNTFASCGQDLDSHHAPPLLPCFVNIQPGSLGCCDSVPARLTGPGLWRVGNGWHPGVAGDRVAQGGEDAGAVLAGGGDVAADRVPVPGDLLGPESS
jgi:hypothetical protein